MIDIADLRIFVCTTPTNMNCSFDRLMGRAQEIFEANRVPVPALPRNELEAHPKQLSLF